MTRIVGLLSIMTLLLIAACSHIKSGQYVQLKQNSSPDELAGLMKVSPISLKVANPEANYRRGEWIFIPRMWGVYPQVKGRSIASLDWNTSYEWPVPSVKKISSGYGGRWGKMHRGIDIPASVGTEIVSTADGVVVYSGDDYSGYGNITIIAHADGIFSLYAHANKNYTRRGDVVHQGQAIASVGNSGISTGPHLHFEIRYDGRDYDPLAFVSIDN